MVGTNENNPVDDASYIGKKYPISAPLVDYRLHGMIFGQWLAHAMALIISYTFVIHSLCFSYLYNKCGAHVLPLLP